MKVPTKEELNNLSNDEVLRKNLEMQVRNFKKLDNISFILGFWTIVSLIGLFISIMF